MRKKHWMSLAAFLVICIIIMKSFYYNKDISMYPIKDHQKTYSAQKTWLISYANEGIYIQNQNNLMMSASIYQVFDVIMPYQPHNIDPEFYSKHKKILTKNRGGGYWLWKPYFILKTLKMMPENDVLLYADSSGVFRDGIYNLLKLAHTNDITVFPNFHSNRGMIKKLVIDKMANGDDSYLDKIQLDASLILLRNTAKSRKIIEEWLSYCEDHELLNDSESKDEYKDFKDHRHDQSILSIMYNKNPELFNLYDAYPARMEAFITTRRKNPCSMLPVTFSDKTEFSWLDGIKYRSIIWLIGCQKFKGS